MASQLTELLRYVRQVDSKPSPLGFAEGSLIFDLTEKQFFRVENGVWVGLSFEVASDVVFDRVAFNTAAGETVSAGTLAWNDAVSTLDLGLSDEVTLQVGQEEVIFARNKSGQVIPNGAAVFITGAEGNKPTVALACAQRGAACEGRTVGLATQEIGINENGFVCSHGTVRGLDTRVDALGLNISAGDTLYLSTTPGEWALVPPPPPDRTVQLGYVTRVNPALGAIFVSIENSAGFFSADDFELNDTSGFAAVTFTPQDNVFRTQTLKLNDAIDVSDSVPAQGDFLQFTDGLWRPAFTDLGIELNNVSSTSYTLIPSDSGKMVTLNNSSPISLVVPEDSSGTFAVGTSIVLAQLGSGTVTVNAASGVTLTSFNNNVDLAGVGATAPIVKIDTNSWLLFGNTT